MPPAWSNCLRTDAATVYQRAPAYGTHEAMLSELAPTAGSAVELMDSIF